MTTRNNQRGLITARPGGNTGLRRITMGPPETRTMDGEYPINFDDWLAEYHAKAVVDLIRPLLVGDWRIGTTGTWGRYTLEDPGWTDKFDIIITFRIDEMKVVVRHRKWPGANQPNGRFVTIPIEHPHTIELLAQFVFEELVEYKDRRVVINRPILSATS